MRPTYHARIPAAPLACLLLLVAALLPLWRPAEPVAAALAQGGSFGSAVPCLLGEDTFATTCFADTIFHRAPAGDPALVRLTPTAKAPLAALGAKAGPTSARLDGVGAIYGLAYDDGAVSGARRLYAAAYTRRLSSFGAGGPGAIYAYDFQSGAWSLALTVPSAGWERTRPDDAFDQDALPHVGRSGLGDIEISPDGRELFVVNIAARRIERYDLTLYPPARRAPIAIDDGARDANDALDAVWAQYRGAAWYTPAFEQGARADTVPFALELSPFVTDDGPLLLLGLTDTNRRGVRDGGLAPPAGSTAVHVVTYRLGHPGPQRWALSLTQSLDDPAIRDRMAGSAIAGLWAEPDLPSRAEPYATRGLRGWNPWHDTLATMPSYPIAGLGQTIYYPQPLLSDIEFTHDGRRMLLGLRDRTGDQVFTAEAPPGQLSAIAQGDTLVYALSGASWALQTAGRASDPVNPASPGATIRPAPSDVFNDSIHFHQPGAAPSHIENHGGAIATALQGDGSAPVDRVAVTSLFGSRQSGVSFYAPGGGQWTAGPNTLVTASAYAGGKVAGLGDLELLCTYAFVGGRLWDDLNGNGTQDAGEPPIAGARLEAFRGAATEPAEAGSTTDAQGRYRFALQPNTPYGIRIAAGDRAPGGRLAGYRLSPHNRGADDTRDSDAAQSYGYIELAGSRGAPTPGVTGAAIAAPVREQELSGLDIGLTRLPAAGAIGDVVWEDRNANGLQDPGEPGVPDAVLAAMGVTLIPDPAAPILLPFTPVAQRPGGGRYLFSGLPPGRYAVRFGAPPAGYSVAPTGAGGGANDARDSDAGNATGLTTRSVLIAEAPAQPTANTDLDLGLVPSRTDVAVTIAAPAAVIVGQPIDYLVTARNLSPGAPAQSVGLSLDLPAGTAFVSAEGAPARQGSRLTWSLGDLAPQQARSFTVRVTAPATMSPPAPPQSLVAAASVATISQESDTGNNSASATTQLVRPAVAIAKAAPTTALVGEEIAYTLSYRNQGSVAAGGAAIDDLLAPGLSFLRFTTNPAGACRYDAGSRRVSCALGSLAPGAAGTVAFAARLEASAPGATMLNTASILTGTPGDDPADNTASTSTAILRPNLGVAATIAPAPFPVGAEGAIAIRYRNGLAAPATGEARDAALTIQLSEGNATLGALPGGCTYTAAARTVGCALGTLAPGAGGELRLPVALPPDFPADRLAATATISSATPERAADLADNSTVAAVDVIRPNVFVDASGPTTIVGRGSVFWYTLDYGNLHRPSPALTRDAEQVVLRATLPPEVELVQADLPPDAVAGRALTWELGTLAGRATGRIVLVVRTAVDAGATLTLDAAISTATPGDNPADNRDSVRTDVVQPPAEIPPVAGDLRLAVRSELDPNSQDRRPDNGVYQTEGARFSWPAGETLDLTPRLRRLSIPGEERLPYPYAYRARVIGWSLRSVTVNGRTYDPAAADSGGQFGCRPGAAPAELPRLLEGCAYGYVDGASIEAIRRAALPHEEQLRDQAHLYWTRPPAPPLPDDVYTYAVDPLTPVRLEVQVEIELRIVNAAPGEIGGIPLPEVPVVPLPDPERRLLAETFEVTLLVPRSVVGPGSP